MKWSVSHTNLEPPSSATLTKGRQERARGSSTDDRPRDAGTTPSRRRKRWSAATKSRIATLVWALVLLGTGGKGLVWVVGDTRLILESADWVAGSATVSRAWLETERGRRQRGSTPRVEYRYSVEGRPYVGSRLEIPTLRYSAKWEAREKLAGLAPGANIAILYDPTDPAQSVIVAPTMDWAFTLGRGALTAGLLALGSWLFSSGVRRRGARAVVALPR